MTGIELLGVDYCENINSTVDTIGDPEYYIKSFHVGTGYKTAKKPFNDLRTDKTSKLKYFKESKLNNMNSLNKKNKDNSYES